MLTKTADEVFAGHNADGSPRMISPDDARVWGRQIERAVGIAGAGSGLIYASRALLYADLAHAANSSAWVVGDATVAYNGVYKKTGASGSGSWSRVWDLPYQVIPLATSGSDNAIVATSALPIPSGDLQCFVPFVAPFTNTGPVTIAINGASAVALKSSTGAALDDGDIVSGTIYVAQPYDGAYRLTVESDFAAALATAEAAADSAQTAKADAETARDLAQEYAEQAANSLAVPIYNTKASVAAASIPIAITAIRTNGASAAGDGDGGLYTTTNNGSTDTVTSANSRTFYRTKDIGPKRLVPALAKRSRADAYMRRVQKRLPLSGGSYASIISTYGHAYLVPSGMVIDQTDKRIYVLYGASSPDTTFYVFVWSYSDWDSPTDATYVSSFRIATSSGYFTEGFVVEHSGSNRYLYARSGGDIIKKYDITTLPADMGLVSATATVVASNAYSQIAKRGSEWFVQQTSITLGAQYRRGHFARLDSSFARTGTVQFANEDVGPWTSSAYANYFPKMQGFAVGDGFFALQLGGKYNSGDTVVPYGYQGIKLAKSNGDVFLEAAMNPATVMSIIDANGCATPTTVEGEGLCIPEDGEIYSLCYYLSTTGTSAPTNTTEGMLIFKEFAKESDAIDFSSAAVTFPSFSRTKFTQGHFPRSPDGPINPITGATFTTLEGIADYMVAMDVPRFEFYSTTFSAINDPSGAAIPSGIYVTIRNSNNSTFFVEYLYAVGGARRTGTLSGTSGSRTLSMSPWNREGFTTLADADVTLTVGSSTQYQSFVTLTAARTVTLSKTGAVDGSRFEIRRWSGAYNATILNGSGGSTIATMGANTYGIFVYQTTSNNWVNWNNV